MRFFFKFNILFLPILSSSIWEDFFGKDTLIRSDKRNCNVPVFSTNLSSYTDIFLFFFFPLKYFGLYLGCEILFPDMLRVEAINNCGVGRVRMIQVTVNLKLSLEIILQLFLVALLLGVCLMTHMASQ
jgi:hypothetical protein